MNLCKTDHLSEKHIQQVFTSQKNSGFTIIELMVGVAMLGIITAVALPSMSKFILGMRIDNEVSALHRLILTSRNTAINMGQPVTLCPLTSNTCTTSWGNELTVFIDINNNGKYEPNGVPADTIIRVQQASESNISLLYPFSRLAYEPTGQTVILGAGGTAGTFRYCPILEKDMARAIEVSPRGRSFVSFDSNNNGKEETRLGTSIVCP